MRKSGWAVAACAAALATAPAAAQGAVQVGSSGWAWGNPSPQGNTVLAASFAGGTGYAAGTFGTLLATADGGTTWTGLRSGTFTDLDEVQAIDTDSVFAGGGCVGRRSDDGGRTFSRVAFTPVESRCRQPLADAFWVSPTTGYLTLEDGTVLATTNNGQTFSPRTAVPGTDPDEGTGDLFFITPVVGLASAGDKLFRTEDGANSWTEVFAGRRISDIHFVDPATGFAVGAGGTFLRTTDGGLTWEARPLGATDALHAVACADGSTCLATAGDGRALVRTTDAGATSARITVSTRPIHALAFASAARAVALGDAGATAVSDDAGATFTPIGGALTGVYDAMVTGPAGTAFAIGDDGVLAKTTDGGRTWQRGNVPTTENVYDVAFATPALGYAIDTDNGVFGTSDGGASWRTLDAGAPSMTTDVLTPDSKTVVLLGEYGVRRSTDAGETFRAIRGRALRGADFFDGDEVPGALFGWWRQRIVRSTDKGRTWRTIRLPSRRTRVTRIDFVTPSTGYMIDTGGRVWRTDSAGRRWRELPSVGFGDPDNVVFSTKNRGYLVISRFGNPSVEAGWLLRTEDGGLSWYPQFVVDEAILPKALAAGPDGTDYLLGGSSGFLSTRTGGASGAPSTLSIGTARKTLRRRGTITVSGRLQPGAANDEVTVSRRSPTGRWQSQTVRTASNGAFTTRWRMARGTSRFVAQWAGGFRSRGDGTSVLTVRVR